MLIYLPNGNDSITIDIPADRLVFVVKPNDLPAVTDELKEIKRSIENPIGTPRLKEIVKGKRKIAIAADDLARVTPCRNIIPILLDELKAGGIEYKDVTLIVALGTHRQMTVSELTHRFGETVMERIRVINHDWQDHDNLVYLGDTQSKTPISINRRYYEADVKIGIGNIQPHAYAGWGGGAKIVQPGISGEVTTARTHLMAVQNPPDQVLGNCDCVVRREIEETARKAGLDFIINTVLNSGKQVIRVFSGDFVKAHRAAVELAEKVFCPEIQCPADVVVAASYPADIDYWQAIKAAKAAYIGVKKGGVIILVTPCSEGIAAYHPDVEKYGKLSFQQVDDMIRKGEIEDLVGASFLLDHAQIINKADIIFVSQGLSDRMCSNINCKKAETVEKALRMAEAKVGPEAKIGIIPYSGVVPRVKSNLKF